VGGGQICDDQSQGNFKQMPGKLSLSRWHKSQCDPMYIGGPASQICGVFEILHSFARQTQTPAYGKGGGINCRLMREISDPGPTDGCSHYDAERVGKLWNFFHLPASEWHKHAVVYRRVWCGFLETFLRKLSLSQRWLRKIKSPAIWFHVIRRFGRYCLHFLTLMMDTIRS
jgi:hypothetical protein